LPTITEEIRRFFRKGTRPTEELENLGKEQGSIELVPYWPPDAFAIAAHLVKQSGAYQYTRFDLTENGVADPFEIYGKNRKKLEKLGAAWAFYLVVDDNVPVQTRRELADRAKKVFHWLNLTPRYLENTCEDDIQSIWRALISDDQEIIPDIAPEAGGKFPKWWRHAIKIMVLADQASKGIGFNPHSSDAESWPQFALETMGQQEQNATPETDLGVSEVHNLVSNIVDSGIVTVLPKSRTPRVGWTLRSLTHHLALLPARGEARAVWHQNLTRPVGGGNVNQNSLNILLVPYPHNIGSDAFGTLKPATTQTDGEFAVSQSWLKIDNAAGEIQNHINRLIDDAKRDSLVVNGIVLPEMALTYEVYDTVSYGIAKERYDDFEFFVSGLGSRPRQISNENSNHEMVYEDGNFVGTRGILKYQKEPRTHNITTDNLRWSYSTIRNKHHRWKLDDRQARRYSVRHRLADDGAWWEGVFVGRRRLDVFQPRAGFTMTTLICEDLARIDPCQEMIRAIGPNLVIALLMDGPQTAYRWPAHYAGVLADDPGCSVLTLTSLGLVSRAAVTDPHQSRSIAFWKDCFGEQHELQLPPGYHGLVVSLEAKQFSEFTLDGRSDGGQAKGWRLAHVTPVKDPNYIVPARTGD